MIASLKGQLAHREADSLIVNVGGVGYEVFFPATRHHQLPPLGDELFLHVQTVVREDSFSLYGFLDSAEKRIFLLLLGVSGVGPKVAMNILAGAEPAALGRAIITEDVVWLKKLPGVGKKTAERLCLELRDKLEFFPVSAGATATAGMPAASARDFVDQPSRDAMSALINLGYPPVRAREALERVRRESGDEAYEALALAELLRRALRSLA